MPGGSFDSDSCLACLISSTSRVWETWDWDNIPFHKNHNLSGVSSQMCNLNIHVLPVYPDLELIQFKF